MLEGSAVYSSSILCSCIGYCVYITVQCSVVQYRVMQPSLVSK